jgi:hypothetical protein
MSDHHDDCAVGLGGPCDCSPVTTPDPLDELRERVEIGVRLEGCDAPFAGSAHDFARRLSAVLNLLESYEVLGHGDSDPAAALRRALTEHRP